MSTITQKIDVEDNDGTVTIKIESQQAQIFRCKCVSILSLKEIPPKQAGSHRVVFEVPAKENSPYSIYTNLADEGAKTKLRQTVVYRGKSKPLFIPTRKSKQTFREAMSGVYLY